MLVEPRRSVDAPCGGQASRVAIVVPKIASPASEHAVPIEDNDLPVLFRSADQFSVRRQRHFLWLVIARYAALVLAAVSGVASLQYRSQEFEWAALGTIVLLLATMGVEILLHVNGPEDDWYDGRVLAESVKTLAWRYTVGARPFQHRSQEDHAAGDRPSLDDREAAIRRDFLAEMQSLLSDVPDIGEPSTADSGITERMRLVRSSSLAVRQATYVQYRIIDQQDWYARKARANRQRQTWLWLTVILAEASALVFAALRFANVMTFDLVGVAVAIVAAVTGWLGVKQFATLARSYAYAAQDLAIVRARLEASMNEDEWAAEAADAEESISREHTLWRSSRSSRFNRGVDAPPTLAAK